MHKFNVSLVKFVEYQTGDVVIKRLSLSRRVIPNSAQGYTYISTSISCGLCMLLNTRQKITYFGDLYLMFQELAQIEIDDYNNLIFSIHPVTITHFFQF